MLGLAQQIGRQILRIAGLIRDNQDFTGACQHIDIDVTINSLFGKGYKDISRARYFSTLGMVSVPKARAATACAPPIL